MKIVDQFLESITQLPMLPKVVQEVTQMLAQENVDFKSIAHVIEHDQILSARVLRMANSAYFGCSQHINTIENAVGLIGVNNVKTLVIATGVTSAFKQVPGLDLNRFWQHSMVTALVARKIAKQKGLDTEAAYLGGLLHTIGQLPIHLVFPEAAATVDEVCRGRSVLERKAVEHSTLGIDHCRIGEMVTRWWHFPEQIVQVIKHYADPFHLEACELAPVVYASVHIAFDLELGKAPAYIAETLDPDVAKHLGWNDMDALTQDIAACAAFKEEARQYL